MNGPRTSPVAPELIVIGGSAGAIEALEGIASGLTPRLAPALAIVVHMPEKAPGRLHEVLQGPGRPAMKPAEDKEPIRPGFVYLAPPGYHLLIERERTFALSVDAPVNYSRPSIDVLFESAAVAYGAHAAGIILSGANADGAAGLRTIADVGGVTLVQDPATAGVDIMPRAALDACPGSSVLSPEGLASWMASLGEAAGR